MNTKKNNSNLPIKTVSAGINQHRKIAIIAGLGLLLMTISIILAEVVVMADIIVADDIQKTVVNITNNQNRFRFGIVAFMGVAILDLLVAWAFYMFLKPAEDNLTILMAWSRLLYTVILGFALINLYSIAQLIGNDGFLSTLEPSQIQVSVRFLLNAFRDTWDVGYILFGIHLLLLGIVAYRSGFIPKAIGVILILAGTSYLIDYLGWVLFPNLGLGVSFIFGYGELIFMIWLFIWGGKKELPTRV